MLFDYLSYMICIVITIYVLFYFYVRLKYGFWATQPVFHDYDIWYKIFPPGILRVDQPTKNKYTNFINIDTVPFNTITSLQKQRFVQLIATNSLWKKNVLFSPKEENILSYLIGPTHKSFISFYYDDHNLFDLKTGNIIVDRRIVGTLTSRPLTVQMNDATFMVYFMDFLCVHKLHRRKGIVSQLLQTHEYNQRLLHKKILVSLIKREGKEKLLRGIVPICRYTSYGFRADTWTKPVELASNYSVIEINAHNFRFLHDFIHTHSDSFQMTIKNDISNILELLKTNNIFIYSIFADNRMQCCYFFRKTCIQVEPGLEALCCFASICNCDEPIFIHGYKISFWKIASKHYFGFSLIENISHNGILIHNIIQKTKPAIIQENAYYFYNFAYPTISPDKCFIIH